MSEDQAQPAEPPQVTDERMIDVANDVGRSVIRDWADLLANSGPDTPTAKELEAASADAFTALEFAHRYGDRFPELSNAVTRRAAERD